MKKLIFVCFYALILSVPAFSQNEEADDTEGEDEEEIIIPEINHDSIRNSKTRHFVIHPLSFFVSGFELGYGKTLNKGYEMFKVVAGYYFSDDPWAYSKGREMEGYRFEFQYLFTKPIDGGIRYYLGGYFTYKSISMGIEEDFSLNGNPPAIARTAKAAASGLGIMFGTHGYILDNFYVDLYMGGGPTFALNRSGEEDVHLAIANPYKRSINPRFGLSLGISF